MGHHSPIVVNFLPRCEFLCADQSKPSGPKGTVVGHEPWTSTNAATIVDVHDMNEQLHLPSPLQC
jgi:hypothetical protein